MRVRVLGNAVVFAAVREREARREEHHGEQQCRERCDTPHR